MVPAYPQQEENLSSAVIVFVPDVLLVLVIINLICLLIRPRIIHFLFKWDSPKPTYNDKYVFSSKILNLSLRFIFRKNKTKEALIWIVALSAFTENLLKNNNG